MMVARRDFIVGSVLVGGAIASGAKVLAEPVLPSVLKLIVSMNGRQYIYDGAAGEDMGTYMGEFVQQRCARVIRPELPLTVFFRPDLHDDRIEVVVELGRMWGREPAHITQPYTAEIVRGSKSLAKVDVPYHWWWARWRWQSAPRPIVRKPSNLIATSLLPPYGEVNGFETRPYGRARTYQGPMDLAGLAYDWGNTGEREEIGPLTEAQANYVLYGTSAAWDTMMAQAEASGSASLHWRDEKTGTFIDFQRYPNASMNEHDGDPLIPNPPNPRTPDDKQDRRFFRVEPAHAGSLAYLPFMLTDDPYYLEELQALGELSIGFSSWFRRLHKLPGLAFPGQTRSFAWSMRSLFQLGMVSPEKPPRWLLPRSYWRKSIADSRAFMQLYMDSPARIHHYFRAFPEVSQIGSWQACMVSFILSWGVMMGYHEWKDAYEWQIGGPIAQCNGRSGWSREWPVPYHWNALKTWQKYEDGRSNVFHDASIDAETCIDWTDAWKYFKADQKIDDSGWDGDRIMETTQSPSYYLYLRGALAMAERLGIAGAKESADWLDNEIPQTLGYGHVKDFARWAVLRD